MAPEQPEESHEPGLVLLERMVATRHIRSVYQPLIRLEDTVCVGIEALARPVDIPDDGSVGTLFQGALRDGTIRDLDWLCRRTAIRTARDVRTSLPLHLNLTLNAVSDPHGDAEKMLALAGDCGRVARSIVLEITDAVTVRPAKLIGAMVAYRMAGFRIAIDGVATSEALELAAAVGPDVIKLHHTVAQRLGESSAVALITAALEAARPIGARVVAQGIESELEAQTLMSMGVRVGQGFFLRRPAPVAALPLDRIDPDEMDRPEPPDPKAHPRRQGSALLDRIASDT